MQIPVISVVGALALSACAFPSWKDPSSTVSDAGESKLSSEQTCVDSRRVCFRAPELTNVSWGLTSISLRRSGVQTGTPTIILAAHGSSEVVELQCGASQIVEVSRLTVSPAPWQVVSSDFDLDGNEDSVVASPGSASQLGVLSLWRGLQADNWTNALTKTVGLGTYAAAARSAAISEEVIAVGASFNAQLLLPIVAHKGANPTAGKSVDLDFGPTAVEFATNPGGNTRLFAVGSTSSRAKLVTFNIEGETLTHPAECEVPGAAPNDIKLADLNGDSLVDAVVVDDSDQSRLYSLLGQSSNSWGAPKQLELSPHSHAAAISDFDRDGYVDVATISGSTPNIQVCFGDGTGAFINCAQIPHGLEQATDLIAIDSDANGWIDILAIGYEGQVSRVRTSLESDERP